MHGNCERCTFSLSSIILKVAIISLYHVPVLKGKEVIKYLLMFNCRLY